MGLFQDISNLTDWVELAHEKPAHLYPTALYVMGAQRACREVGVTDGVIGCWYANHEMSYLAISGSFTRAGNIMLRRLEQNDKLLNKIVQANENQIPVMIEAARALTGSQIETLNGSALYSRWLKWLESFMALMTWSAMGTVLEWEEPLLSNKLERILAERLGAERSEIVEYFQVLTSPSEITIAGREAIYLLKLRQRQLRGQQIDEDVAAHVKAYSWIAFGYDGPGWDAADIQHRLNDLPDSPQKIDKILEEKNIGLVRIAEKQSIFIDKLKLSEKENRLFNSLRLLGFWKFERKFRNQLAHQLMEDFLNNIAKRNNITLHQAKMIAPHEMEDAVKNNTVDRDQLAERVRESVIVFRGLDYEVWSGEAAKPIIEKIVGALRVDKDVDEVRGATAYPGQARGVVKRVDVPKDMEKLRPGDILVAASTGPQILPAMKISGAIVTDTGGITCHAAIVARELQKPCIIGTRIATKVLNDGDEVEVDAERGVVKKIT